MERAVESEIQVVLDVPRQQDQKSETLRPITPQTPTEVVMYWASV